VPQKRRITSLFGDCLAGKEILIVDDNPLNLELISDILEANGYEHGHHRR